MTCFLFAHEHGRGVPVAAHVVVIAFLASACVRGGSHGPHDVEVTSVEIRGASAEMLRRHATTTSSKPDGAAASLEPSSLDGDASQRTAKGHALDWEADRAQIELSLRARIDLVEERLDALEGAGADGTGGADPSLAHWIQRREDLLLQLDSVRRATAGSWLLVRAEAEAALAIMD